MVVMVVGSVRTCVAVACLGVCIVIYSLAFLLSSYVAPHTKPYSPPRLTRLSRLDSVEIDEIMFVVSDDPTRGVAAKLRPSLHPEQLWGFGTDEDENLGIHTFPAIFGNKNVTSVALQGALWLKQQQKLPGIPELSFVREWMDNMKWMVIAEEDLRTFGEPLQILGLVRFYNHRLPIALALKNDSAFVVSKEAFARLPTLCIVLRQCLSALNVSVFEISKAPTLVNSRDSRNSRNSRKSRLLQSAPGRLNVPSLATFVDEPRSTRPERPSELLRQRTWQTDIPVPQWSNETSVPRITRSFCHGSSIFQRTCAFEGLCYNVQEFTWTIFDPHATQEVHHCTTDGNGMTHSNQQVPDGEYFLSMCSLIERRARWKPQRVVRQYIPRSDPRTDRRAKVLWVDRPTAMMWRHQPPNFAHSMQDDFYALYWILRTWFYREGLPLKPVAGAIFVDDHPPGSELFTYQVFKHFIKHGVHPATAGNFANVLDGTFDPFVGKHVATKFEPAVRYVCFRQLAIGIPGITMQRNEGYDDPSRNYRPALDESHYVRSQIDYIDFLLSRYGLPSRTSFDFKEWNQQDLSPVFQPSVIPVRWPRLVNISGHTPTILIANRKGSRGIQNVVEVRDALVAAFGLRTQVVFFEELGGQAEQARYITNSNVVYMVGVHGAQFWNSVFMTPGSFLLEFVPSEMGAHIWRLYKWMALHLGLNHDHIWVPGGKYTNVVVPIDSLISTVRSGLELMTLT